MLRSCLILALAAFFSTDAVNGAQLSKSQPDSRASDSDAGQQVELLANGVVASAALTRSEVSRHSAQVAAERQAGNKGAAHSAHHATGDVKEVKGKFAINVPHAGQFLNSATALNAVEEAIANLTGVQMTDVTATFDDPGMAVTGSFIKEKKATGAKEPVAASFTISVPDGLTAPKIALAINGANKAQLANRLGAVFGRHHLDVTGLYVTQFNAEAAAVHTDFPVTAPRVENGAPARCFAATALAVVVFIGIA